MNFSEPIKLGGPHAAAVSPNDIYVASVMQRKLFVRWVDSLQVYNCYTCRDIVCNFIWAPNSCNLLCYLKKKGAIQILSLKDPGWSCIVDDDPLNLNSAAWLPDSLHFLTTTEFSLRITVWSLTGSPVVHFKHIKACPNNFSISPDGRYLALLERHEYRDYFSLFDSHSDWFQLYHSPLDTQDCVGIMWSPDCRHIVVWDDCLRYQIIFYSLDGRLLATYSAYDTAKESLGVKTISWSPTGQLMAVGSYDQKCRLLNAYDWSCLATLPHPLDKPIDPYLGLGPTHIPLHNPCVSNEPDNVRVVSYRSHRIDAYEERPTESDQFLNSASKVRSAGVTYHLLKGSFVVSSIEPDPKIPYPQIGVGSLAFSANGRFLATRNDNSAHCVWIWSIDHRLSLFSLLLHTSGSVATFAWDPSSPARLALCTRSDCVFMWSPQGCLAVQTPVRFNFLVNTLSWLTSGDALLLVSDKQFCLCYLDADDTLTNTKQPSSWYPPGQTAHQLPHHLAIDSPMPIGKLGFPAIEDSSNSSQSTTIDGPNWLRQHTDELSQSDLHSRKTENRDSGNIKLLHPHRQAWCERKSKNLSDLKRPNVS